MRVTGFERRVYRAIARHAPNEPEPVFTEPGCRGSWLIAGGRESLPAPLTEAACSRVKKRCWPPFDSFRRAVSAGSRGSVAPMLEAADQRIRNLIRLEKLTTPWAREERESLRLQVASCYPSGAHRSRVVIPARVAT